MKKTLTLLLALPLLLMSSTCEDSERVTACMFRNDSGDTLVVVVSTEYPDTLFPMTPHQIIYECLPGTCYEIYVDEDWFFRNDAVLQFFVYDHSIPQLGTYLRGIHPERARLEISMSAVRDYQGMLTYPPIPNKSNH